MMEAIPVIVHLAKSGAIPHALVSTFFHVSLCYAIYTHDFTKIFHTLTMDYSPVLYNPCSNTVDTCPACGDPNAYCGCDTGFQCQCYSGYTGNGDSCEGIIRTCMAIHTCMCIQPPHYLMYIHV